jgi:hypothetical protein
VQRAADRLPHPHSGQNQWAELTGSASEHEAGRIPNYPTNRQRPAQIAGARRHNTVEPPPTRFEDQRTRSALGPRDIGHVGISAGPSRHDRHRGIADRPAFTLRTSCSASDFPDEFPAACWPSRDRHSLACSAGRMKWPRTLASPFAHQPFWRMVAATTDSVFRTGSARRRLSPALRGGGAVGPLRRF